MQIQAQRMLIIFLDLSIKRFFFNAIFRTKTFDMFDSKDVSTRGLSLDKTTKITL